MKKKGITRTESMNSTMVDPYRFSIPKAQAAQTCLSKNVIAEDRLPPEIRFVAGVDVAYAGDLAFGAVAVLDFDSLRLVESQVAVCTVKFPYVPTLLSFREFPAAVAAIKKLKTKPDVYLVDAHGLAHPRRCGFASHLGLVIKQPTIGVAKSRLIGEPTSIGESAFLVDDGQVLGAVVETKERAKPVYVSVGNLVSLETAVKVVKRCVRNSRIPEPILWAHKIAARAKNSDNR